MAYPCKLTLFTTIEQQYFSLNVVFRKDKNMITKKRKQELIELICNALDELIQCEEESTDSELFPEMLTISECVALIDGLTEFTVRTLVTSNQIPYFRTGQGKRGKILINKAAFLKYFNEISQVSVK